MPAPDSPFTHKRESARRAATSLVSVALGLMGLALMALAVVLVVRGGWGFLFLSLVVGALGFGLAFVGFFFQLVPLKLDELADQKRDYDRRMRER